MATRIVTKNGTEVPIDYRLLKKGDRWLVYDVNIEGVSLVSNYRTQFNKIIQTGSFEDLIQKLRTKQGELTRGRSIQGHEGDAREEVSSPGRTDRRKRRSRGASRPNRWLC